jgi:hypothetical protein
MLHGFQMTSQENVQWCEAWRMVPSTDTTSFSSQTRLIMYVVALDTHHQTDAKINMWCGINGSAIVRFAFLNKRLKEDCYHYLVPSVLFSHSSG